MRWSPIRGVLEHSLPRSALLVRLLAPPTHTTRLHSIPCRTKFSPSPRPPPFCAAHSLSAFGAPFSAHPLTTRLIRVSRHRTEPKLLGANRNGSEFLRLTCFQPTASGIYKRIDQTLEPLAGTTANSFKQLSNHLKHLTLKKIYGVSSSHYKGHNGPSAFVPRHDASSHQTHVSRAWVVVSGPFLSCCLSLPTAESQFPKIIITGISTAPSGS